MKFAPLALLALAGGAHAASPGRPTHDPVTPRARMAQLEGQRVVLEEEMGRLQLDLLVSEIVAERSARKPARARLTLASARP